MTNSSTTNIYSSLSAGTYSCNVTDINGCLVSSANIVIGQPDEITFFMSSSDVFCNGDV